MQPSLFHRLRFILLSRNRAASLLNSKLLRNDYRVRNHSCDLCIQNRKLHYLSENSYNIKRKMLFHVEKTGNNSERSYLFLLRKFCRTACYFKDERIFTDKEMDEVENEDEEVEEKGKNYNNKQNNFSNLCLSII